MSGSNWKISRCPYFVLNMGRHLNNIANGVRMRFIGPDKEKEYYMHMNPVPEAVLHWNEINVQAWGKAIMCAGAVLLVIILFLVTGMELFSEKMAALLAVAVAAIFLVADAPRKQVRDQWKKRLRALTREYSDMVSLLAILIRAGLPVRKAWMQISEDYEKTLERGGKHKYSSEEIRFSVRQLENGISESDMYIQFGRRCGLQSYMHLGILLREGLIHGSDSIAIRLSEEAANALEERKNSSRKLGSEAETKLMIPTMLFLIVVMAEILYPAMTSFSI